MYVSATSTRFSRGMSTPAIRAMTSALPLLVLGVGADDHHGAVTADDFAVVAACLHGGSDFQRFLGFLERCTLVGARGVSLLEPVRDPASRQVVGRQFDPDAITGQDPDEVHPELAADMCQHPMAILELDREHRVRKR